MDAGQKVLNVQYPYLRILFPFMKTLVKTQKNKNVPSKKTQPIVIVVLTCSQCCTMLCFFFRGEDDAKPRIYHCLLSLGALSLLILPGSDIRPGA